MCYITCYILLLLVLYNMDIAKVGYNLTDSSWFITRQGHGIAIVILITAPVPFLPLPFLSSPEP